MFFTAFPSGSLVNQFNQYVYHKYSIFRRISGGTVYIDVPPPQTLGVGRVPLSPRDLRPCTYVFNPS